MTGQVNGERKKRPLKKIITSVGTENVPLGARGFLVFFQTCENYAGTSAGFVKLLEECARNVQLPEIEETEGSKEVPPALVQVEETELDITVEADGSEDGEDDATSHSECSSASNTVDESKSTGQVSQPSLHRVPQFGPKSSNSPSQHPQRNAKSKRNSARKGNTSNFNPLETFMNGGEEVFTRRSKMHIKRRTFFAMQGPTKNMAKPQLKFKTTVNNDDSPFVPKLPVKFHATRNWEEKALQDPKTKKIYYEHPYKYEIENWLPPPPFMTFTPHRWRILELERTPFSYVETMEQFRKMLSELNQASEIGFDVEHSDRSYFGLTCLIQISTRYQDYVIDVFAPEIRDSLFNLNDAFANPNILKVAHGAQCDIIYLQRDFGIYVVGLFDTCTAEKVILSETRSAGLATLLAKYVNVQTDKKYQLADWRIRPLTPEMMEYARMDTHYLLHIYDHQKEMLLSSNDREPLFQVYEDSKKTSLIRYEKPDFTDWLGKKCRDLNNQQRYAAGELNKWRDSVARKEDDSNAIIASNRTVITLARLLPSSETEIIDALKGKNGVFTAYMRQDRDILLKIFSDARALPLVAGIDPITRVVCQQISLDDPNKIFYSSEFLSPSRVVRKVLDLSDQQWPNGVARVLAVDKTSKTDILDICDTIKSLVAPYTSSSKLYGIVSNYNRSYAKELETSIQAAIKDVNPTWALEDLEASEVSIVIFTIRPRSFISVITDCDRNQRFRIQDDDYL